MRPFRASRTGRYAADAVGGQRDAPTAHHAERPPAGGDGQPDRPQAAYGRQNCEQAPHRGTAQKRHRGLLRQEGHDTGISTVEQPAHAEQPDNHPERHAGVRLRRPGGQPAPEKQAVEPRTVGAYLPAGRTNSKIVRLSGKTDFRHEADLFPHTLLRAGRSDSAACPLVYHHPTGHPAAGGRRAQVERDYRPEPRPAGYAQENHPDDFPRHTRPAEHHQRQRGAGDGHARPQETQQTSGQYRRAVQTYPAPAEQPLVICKFSCAFF